MRIGLDFDNTIVIYDAVFRKEAHALGLLPDGFDGGKKAVREHIRGLDDGERLWTRLQGRVYGAGINDAETAAGLTGFLDVAVAKGHELMVVSHKTEYPAAGDDKINLRAAARDWLYRRALPGLDVVHFESTRAGKLNRIGGLACDVFIDDLLEVFEEPAFPSSTKPILYLCGVSPLPTAPIPVFNHWDSIARHMFGVEPQ